MNVIKKLQRRFMLISIVVVALFIAALISVYTVSISTSMQNQTYTMLAQLASRPLLLNDQDQGDTALPYFAVQQRAGTNSYFGGGTFDISHFGTIEDLVRNVMEQKKNQGKIEGLPLLYYVQSSPQNGTTIVFADISTNEEQLITSIWQSIIYGLLVLVAFCVFAWWFAKMATRPVAQALEEQRQFVSDASHELKTPLTVLLANAELLCKEPLNPEEKRHATTLYTTAKRMRTLTERLLTLSRSERAITTAQEAINASKAANEICLSYEALCFEAGHELQIHLAQNISARIDKAEFEELISILLDNACKYSDGAGPITVSLSTRKNKTYVSVSNPAVSFNPNNISLLFKRFWRSDTSRTDSSSYGLGLSIAQSLVERNRGTIAASYDAHTITFTATLPA